MVFVEPSKSIKAPSLWLDEKTNQYFLLQRHRAAETRLRNSLQLVRNVLGPASGADGYRIIMSVQPFYQVAAGFERQDILQDWEWIEENLMPHAERMDARNFRILVVKYFSELAHGVHLNLPHSEPDRLGGKKQQQRLPEDEDIAVLDPDLLEDEPIDEVDLEGDDVPIRESNSTSSSVGELEALQPEPSHSEEKKPTEWAGLLEMPEQFTHPFKAFNRLCSLARGTESDGWQYLREEAGITVYKKEINDSDDKREIYKGTVVIDASAKNILEMLGKVEQWPRWDRTLSTVEVLDRIDDKNDILHIGLKKFFPAFSSLTETLTLSKSIAETERDMVVFKSCGLHEHDSYVLFFRSVNYDRSNMRDDVIRVETHGSGFLIEPMNSIFPSPTLRSPLNKSSSLASSSIVTFVSDIDWKGWLIPMMGEYIHFTKVMLLKEIKDSFTPDLAFVKRQLSLPPPEEQAQVEKEESTPSSFQSLVKGFATFLEEKKKMLLEEPEIMSKEENENSGKGASESEIGFLDRVKSILDTAKDEKNIEGDAPEESSAKTETGLWSQWKQALTPKSMRMQPQAEGIEMKPLASDKRGWLDKVKGALSNDNTSTMAAPPQEGSESPGETIEEQSTTLAESTNEGGWLNRVRESITTKKSNEKGDSTENGWLERMKEAVRRKEMPTTVPENKTQSGQILTSTQFDGGKGKEEEAKVEGASKQENDKMRFF